MVLKWLGGKALKIGIHTNHYFWVELNVIR